MIFRIRRNACIPLFLSLILAGCAAEFTAVQTDRVFTLVGTLGAPRWTSPDVPGSTVTRPGTTLPAFLVCETGNDSQLRAAAVIDRGTLTLRGDGTSELELGAGAWWSSDGVIGGSGSSVSEFGRWTEPTPGTIHLSGFTTVGFKGPFQYTESGSGLVAMTVPCPSVSSAVSLTPELVFSRVR